MARAGCVHAGAWPAVKKEKRKKAVGEAQRVDMLYVEVVEFGANKYIHNT
jgi:hypothetical protein